MLKSADQIARQTRTEIFFGVVAPVGVEVDTFVAQLEGELRNYGYRSHVWRLSGYIEDFQGIKINAHNEDTRLRTAMDGGTSIRETIGPDALARAAMLDLAKWRVDREESQHSHIFRSLKHPEEVSTLKLVYGRGFHLIGLFSPESARILTLSEKPGMNLEKAKDHVERDRNEEGKPHGQRTRDTFQLADVYIQWGVKPDTESVKRFLRIVFGDPHQTPTQNEHFMFLAFCSSFRSGELSRQVGAALVSDKGDLIALGANDVPCFGGGLYWPGENDQRDLVKGFDSNTKRKNDVVLQVVKALKPEVTNLEEALQLLADSPIADLTEYGRAVHAEMDALLTCARIGQSTVDGTLYVTTYPCHTCTRHIIASGLRTVVFVEPYPKSRAMELHGDAIQEVVPESEAAPEDKVIFRPYLGIGPRRFVDYFSMALSDGYQLNRKSGADGRKIEWKKTTTAPRVPLSELAFPDVEKELATELEPYLKSADDATKPDNSA